MEKLGIEPSLLLAQVINFLVIMVILNKLLYKPILTMIAKRKKEISEGVTLTETMRQEQEDFKVSQEKSLAKAREACLVIIEDAKKQAKEVEKDLVADAHKQVEAILVRAKTEALDIKKSAKSEIRKEAIDLAVVMAKRLLSSVLNAKDQHALVSKQVKNLETWAAKNDL